MHVPFLVFEIIECFKSDILAYFMEYSIDSKPNDQVP